MYGFYDKKFQYESQTLENNFYKIFSSKPNLIKKKNKIIKLVNSCDLIIINNNIHFYWGSGVVVIILKIKRSI